jgi:hypothetical protein
MNTITTLVARLLAALNRIANPPRIVGVFYVDSAGRAWRA